MMSRWNAFALLAAFTTSGAFAAQQNMEEAAAEGGAEAESRPTTFQELDSNEDGYISQEEAAENPLLVEQWMALDRDESGQLDHSEFAAFEETEPQDDVPVPQ